MSKSTCRDGKWVQRSTFMMFSTDEDGSKHNFDVSLTKVQKPTQTIAGFRIPSSIVFGEIHRIHYRFKPTAAVTFTLRIWRYDVDGGVLPYEENANLLYESPPAQASDVDYDRSELTIPFWLLEPGNIYYSIEWTGAPGTTLGFLEVTGVHLG